jgi:hypothetical protein
MKAPSRLATGSATALGVLLLASCASSPERVEYHMDYKSYDSVAAMCEASSVVVLGSAGSSEVREINIAAQPGDSEIENPSLGTGDPIPTESFIIETVTTFEVTKVIVGNGVSEGDTIEVGQPGGAYKGTEYEAEMYSLNKSEEHMLFLQLYPGIPANLLNPMQSAVPVREGVLVPLVSNTLAKELGGITADSVCGDLAGMEARYP